MTSRQVGRYVVAQGSLEGFRIGEGDAAQGPVEQVQVEPVRRIGYGPGHQCGEFGAVRLGGFVALLELLPADGGALGVGGEEPVVVGVGEFAGDERPDVTPEVQRARSGEEFLDTFGSEVVRKGRALPSQP